MRGAPGGWLRDSCSPHGREAARHPRCSKRRAPGFFSACWASPVRPAQHPLCPVHFGIILGLAQISAFSAPEGVFGLDIFHHVGALLAVPRLCSGMLGGFACSSPPFPPARRGERHRHLRRHSMSAVGGPWVSGHFHAGLHPAGEQADPRLLGRGRIRRRAWAGKSLVEVLPKVGILGRIAAASMAVALWCFSRASSSTEEAPTEHPESHGKIPGKISVSFRVFCGQLPLSMSAALARLVNRPRPSRPRRVAGARHGVDGPEERRVGPAGRTGCPRHGRPPRANAKDLAAAKKNQKLPSPQIDRLTLTPQRIAQMAEGVRQSPRSRSRRRRRWSTRCAPTDSRSGKSACPSGSSASSYEARPNVTIDCAVLS